MTDDGEHAPRKSRLSGLLGNTNVLVGIAGALALVALNAVQFVYVLNPRLRPDPNERLGAALRPLSVERRVYIGDYLERVTSERDIAGVEDAVTRATLDTARPTAAEVKRERRRAMCREGAAVYVDVTVDGLKRREVELASFLYTARDRRRVHNVQQVLAPRRLSSPTDRFVEAVWVDQPPEPTERYFVRVELRTVGSKKKVGTLLAIGDSKRFTGWQPGLEQCLSR
jgi:hypothetical protein